MKICTTCKIDLPLEAFAIRRASKDGLNYICRNYKNTLRNAARAVNKEAFRKKEFEYETKNRERIRLRMRGWARANTDKLRAYAKKWRRENPEQAKSGCLKQCYGISLADYNGMLIQQNGACAICNSSHPNRKNSSFFHVDHDHVTGAVRGLLCSNCNFAIGHAKDRPAVLRAAADYLELHSSKVAA